MSGLCACITSLEFLFFGFVLRGFGTWQDEDFIGRVPPSTCMHEMSWLNGNHAWYLHEWFCLMLVLGEVCRVTRRCHAFGIAVRTTTRCLSHSRRLWQKKKWFRWKRKSFSDCGMQGITYGIKTMHACWTRNLARALFFWTYETSRKTIVGQKKSEHFFRYKWGFRYDYYYQLYCYNGLSIMTSYDEKIWKVWMSWLYSWFLGKSIRDHRFYSQWLHRVPEHFLSFQQLKMVAGRFWKCFESKFENLRNPWNFKSPKAPAIIGVMHVVPQFDSSIS